MLREYADITGRLGKPLWWDDNGVPRYDAFSPEQCGVYDDFVALLLIECQGCHKTLRVARSRKKFESMAGTGIVIQTDENNFPREAIVAWWYGDPPYHEADGMRCAGTTMTSDVVQVLEFWYRDAGTWKRDRQQEFVVPREEV